jgi:hypothetical protein
MPGFPLFSRAYLIISPGNRLDTLTFAFPWAFAAVFWDNNPALVTLALAEAFCLC